MPIIINSYLDWWVAMAMALLAWGAWRKRWLNGPGGVGAALLGWIMWLGGGWQALLALFFFFLTGTLLGRLPTQVLADRKQHQPRDLVQVLCNGGVAGASMLANLFHPDPLWIWLVYLALATATADTWSSSVGQWHGGRVIDLLTLRPSQPGISGGISLAGTLAGLAGALCIGLLAWSAGVVLASDSMVVGLAGLAGMLADSALGSWLQPKFRLSDGRLADFVPEGEKGVQVSGFRWMSNDAVNLCSILAITLVAALIKGI